MNARFGMDTPCHVLIRPKLQSLQHFLDPMSDPDYAFESARLEVSMFIRHFSAVLLLPVAFSACEGGIQVFTYDDDVPPIEVQGSGLIGTILQGFGVGVSSNVDFTIASSAEQQGELIEIELTDMAFRTVLDNDASDGDQAALLDRDLIESCRTDQKPISFIHSMTLTVEIEGDASSATEFATYVLPEADRGSSAICGFRLTPTANVDLNQFLPNFEISTSVEGEAPTETTDIGGYYELGAFVRIN